MERHHGICSVSLAKEAEKHLDEYQKSDLSLKAVPKLLVFGR